MDFLLVSLTTALAYNLLPDGYWKGLALINAIVFNIGLGLGPLHVVLNSAAALYVAFAIHTTVERIATPVVPVNRRLPRSTK